MDKKLKDYKNFIKNKVKNLEDNQEKLKKESTGDFYKELENLIDYHNETIKIFQHERLIHLIVTFFFAILFLISVFVSIYIATTSSLALLSMSTIIVIILFITETFYIHHYYQLENGTQSLYEFTKRLYQLKSKSKF